MLKLVFVLGLVAGTDYQYKYNIAITVGGASRQGTNDRVTVVIVGNTGTG